ncbi:glycosyltransferase family 2 protein [Pontiella sulfatireligans]|uniref:Polyprenol monophosphomannose synthase n=1 Tax=Pontiella sulfatireligans TaxID=2750658 RepID=A0A6C2ULQ5_9BACT|nr:glycosyltransferase family 2 protein [Pontiella sulfatireligans]VGO21192.1 Polyprenol monophosphomannose synthase [Pontiella sulfatireligans]
MENGNNTKRIDKFCVLICAFNESKHIESVVRGAVEQNPCRVVVVDDGSTDGTAELAEKAGAYVVRNSENAGKGASLKRGFELVQEHQCDAVIVVDGDGQHDPREIGRFLDAYERTKIPILVGNRMSDIRGMPIIRRWTNRFMAWILNRLVKIYVADPPCGYRFYRTDVLPFIMSDMPRFAFEFDILLHAALRRVRIDSVRVSTIYNRGRRSYVSPFRDAWLLFKVVKHHFLEGRR